MAKRGKGAGSSLTWFGKEVTENVRKASIFGVNKTMSECVIQAKNLVHKDTTVLQGSIRAEPAKVSGDGVAGRWGSFDVNYALWQEVLPGERGGKAYLRPSADQNYSNLAGHIRSGLA